MGVGDESGSNRLDPPLVVGGEGADPSGQEGSGGRESPWQGEGGEGEMARAGVEAAGDSSDDRLDEKPSSGRAPGGGGLSSDGPLEGRAASSVESSGGGGLSSDGGLEGKAASSVESSGGGERARDDHERMMFAVGSDASLRLESLADRPPKAPLSGSRRFFHAYSVTFLVIASYLWLRLWGRLLGPSWEARALAVAHRRNARRVERAITRLQGLFIKAGQVISVMTNFLPDDFRAGLEGLQDQVPPRRYEQIRRRIVADLGAEPEELFLEFERTPIASASIAQVHVARLPSGEKVAVKIQHHDLERLVATDMRTIRRILTLVQLFLPVQGLDAFYRELSQMIEREMDFRAEADAIERIARNFADEPLVRFPRVYRELSTSHVLTLEFIEGCKIGDIARLDEMGIDRAALARRVVRTYCQMIFIDGEYHADPHPGNLLVQPDGGVVFLDFGAVANLSAGMRQGITEFFMGVIKRNTEKILSALRTMGFLARSPASEEVGEKVVEYFHRRFQEEIRLESFNLKDLQFDPQLGIEGMLDLSRMDIGLRELTAAFHVPKEWVLLERTLILLTGVCSILDPQMNPTEVIRPYLEEFVLGKDRDWTEVLLEAAKDTVVSYLALPAEIRRFTNRAIRGEMRFRLKGMERGFRLLYALGHQMIFTALAVTSAIFGYVLHRDGQTVAAYGCLAGSAWFFLLLMGSMILATRHLPPRS